MTVLGITPLISTLGVNALLTGALLQITNGALTAEPAPALRSFAFDTTWGVPNTVLVAGGLVVVVALLMRTTVAGRRFVTVGTNVAAAYVAGIKVKGYIWGTYIAASLFYGLAAVLLAGYLGTPDLQSGSNYLFLSITVVVLGGASLAGGSGSVLGSAIGAVFLIQLQQDVFGAGAPQSVQYLIQAGVIALAMALRTLIGRLDTRTGAPPSRRALGAAAPEAATGEPAPVPSGEGAGCSARRCPNPQPQTTSQ